MLIKVRAWISKHKMIMEGDKVLVACSGGPDSLALLHIFKTICAEYKCSIFAAHVDHMFRGLESAQEAAFVVAFCQEQGIPCYHTAIDVPKVISQTKLSGQDAARVVRYQYLRKVAEELGGAKIATGHHRDDQAETVLINMLRGAGSVGIGGIKPIHGDLMRPLLCVSRAEIMEYCQVHDLKPRFDSSNLKTKYLRNRIRITLLPELEKEYNVAIKDALCRTATLVGDEHDFIRKTADSLWNQVVAKGEQQLLIKSEKMENLHIAVQREIFRLAIEKKQGGLTGISFHHVETLVELLATGQVGSVVQLPGGLTACKSYEGLYLGGNTVTALQKVDYTGQEILVPGITMIPELGIMLITELTDGSMPKTQSHIGVFDWLTLSKPLLVRTRHPGEKFRPLGFSGNKKLKEFLIDEKVPRQERDYIPIICDSKDIIWVGGYRQAQAGKVTEQTKKTLQIKIVKLQEK